MKKYHVRVIGGWCGNRMVMVADHINDLLIHTGFPCQVTYQSVWETYALPPSVDMLLQLLPAFDEVEAGCPVINIKPLLVDLDDPATVERVLTAVKSNYPAQEVKV
jgi:hypothetical protein